MITKIAILGCRSLREDWAQVPQRRDRGQWQRQVEPLSRAALAGGHRARAHHSVVGGGGRASFHAVGRPESFARSVKRGEQPVQGTVRKARLMRSRYLSVPSDSSAAFKGRSSPCCRISFSKNTWARRSSRTTRDPPGPGRRGDALPRHAARPGHQRWRCEASIAYLSPANNMPRVTGVTPPL